MLQNKLLALREFWLLHFIASTRFLGGVSVLKSFASDLGLLDKCLLLLVSWHQVVIFELQPARYLPALVLSASVLLGVAAASGAVSSADCFIWLTEHGHA